jgi:hypothetical protein
VVAGSRTTVLPAMIGAPPPPLLPLPGKTRREMREGESEAERGGKREGRGAYQDANTATATTASRLPLHHWVSRHHHLSPQCRRGRQGGSRLAAMMREGGRAGSGGEGRNDRVGEGEAVMAH